MSITDKMIYLRSHSGLSTDEISEKSGVPVGTINKIFTGETKNPTGKTASKLAKVFGVTAEYLLNDGIPIEYTNVELMDPVPPWESTRGMTDAERAAFYRGLHQGEQKAKTAPSDLPEEALKIAKDYSKLDERGKGAVKAILEYEGKSAAESTPKQTATRPKVVTLPKVKRSHDFTEVEVFDQPAAAGLGNQIDAPPSHVEQYPSDYVPTKTNFGVLISGDSMEPKIPNGSTVFVQATPVLDNGEIGIFVLDGKAYCKQLKKDVETQQVKLHSLNPEYEDIEIPPFAELRTLGRVLGGYDPQTRDVI